MYKMKNYQQKYTIKIQICKNKIQIKKSQTLQYLDI